MALPYDVVAVPATIAAGTSLAGPISLGARVVIGISLAQGGTWTAAPITFQVSTDGTTWQELYDMSGNEIQIAAASTAAGAYCYLDPSFWRGINMIKIRSGTAAAPVNQASQQVVNVVIRAEA